MSTTKYNLITFVPYFLFETFSRLAYMCALLGCGCCATTTPYCLRQGTAIGRLRTDSHMASCFANDAVQLFLC